MNDLEYTRIYQTLFRLVAQLRDGDENERMISFMLFDTMNKMQAVWGNECVG